MCLPTLSRSFAAEGEIKMSPIEKEKYGQNKT
jgi:hypothetical protein